MEPNYDRYLAAMEDRAAARERELDEPDQTPDPDDETDDDPREFRRDA